MVAYGLFKHRPRRVQVNCRAPHRVRLVYIFSSCCQQPRGPRKRSRGMFTGLVGLRVFAASELNESLFTNAPSQAGRPSYIAERRRSAECSRSCPGSRRLMRIFF